jgi:hypothetical protein
MTNFQVYDQLPALPTPRERGFFCLVITVSPRKPLRWARTIFVIAGTFSAPEGCILYSQRSTMKFDETIAFSARADYCRNQASMTEDAKLKAYWQDLAFSWTALDVTTTDIDNHLNARLIQMR